MNRPYYHNNYIIANGIKTPHAHKNIRGILSISHTVITSNMREEY